MEQQPEEVARLVGGLGWLAVGAVVAVWDFKAEETLSSAFRRYQPYSGTVLAYTAAHLMGWLPPELDMFTLLGRRTPSSE